jgi:outer membrane protein W
MKLRTIGMTVVAAIALVAGRVQAQDAAAPAPAAGEDAGWNTKYGILFTLPNPFSGHADGDHSLLGDYDGKVGFQYNLAPQAALRLSAKLGRTSTGTTETTTGTVTNVTVPGTTSSYTANLMAQYMIRMTTAAISPYAGVGAFVNFDQSNRKGDAKASGVVTAKYDDYTRNSAIGLNATLGLEWRVHKAIALFAEYQADLTLAKFYHQKNKDTTGTTTTETESKQKSFAALTTGIAQGGQLGVLAFF